MVISLSFHALQDILSAALDESGITGDDDGFDLDFSGTNQTVSQPPSQVLSFVFNLTIY